MVAKGAKYFRLKGGALQLAERVRKNHGIAKLVKHRFGGWVVLYGPRQGTVN